jgi:hypothetical protein
MSETALLRVMDGIYFLNTNTLEELIEQHNAMFRRRGALRAQVARLDAAIEALDREIAFVDACAVVDDDRDTAFLVQYR